MHLSKIRASTRPQSCSRPKYLLVQILGLILSAAPMFVADPARAQSDPSPRLPPNAPAADVAELARQTQRWLAAAPPNTHVIQLASAKEAGEAAVLLGSLNAATPQPVRVLHGLSRGEPAWMILAGEFPNRDMAMAALRALPASPAGVHTRQGAPFLRTVGKMRSVVLPTG